MIPDGQAKGDFPPENRYTSRKMDAIGTNISPGKNVGNANLVAQDSLMMVGDQKLFPVELSSSSNLLKEKKTNEKVSKAVEMMKGQNDNLFPDDKQGLSSTKSSGSKSGDNSSDSSPSKQSSTKGPAVIEIPETAIASNSSASTAKGCRFIRL
ncbi:unnamed protein product [Toxocara canis]|uniref:Ovule protein n=1 Tax=Toxocara canis TaxID=6265 RepID=A0A183U1D2_TOXCA|nr:unnamed protein product [Toxocara canis]